MDHNPTAYKIATAYLRVGQLRHPLPTVIKAFFCLKKQTPKPPHIMRNTVVPMSITPAVTITGLIGTKILVPSVFVSSLDGDTTSTSLR